MSGTTEKRKMRRIQKGEIKQEQDKKHSDEMIIYSQQYHITDTVRRYTQ